METETEKGKGQAGNNRELLCSTTGSNSTGEEARAAAPKAWGPGHGQSPCFLSNLGPPILYYLLSPPSPSLLPNHMACDFPFVVEALILCLWDACLPNDKACADK